MLAVGDIGQRGDHSAFRQKNADDPLVVHGRHLLALAKVAKSRLPLRRLDSEGCAVAGAAAVEAEDEARPLRRAAMDVRIDAEAAPVAAQQAALPFGIDEARPPHQGAVTEHPEIAFGRRNQSLAVKQGFAAYPHPALRAT